MNMLHRMVTFIAFCAFTGSLLAQSSASAQSPASPGEAPAGGQGAPQVGGQASAQGGATASGMVYYKSDKMIAELDTKHDGCIHKQAWVAAGLPEATYSILEGQAAVRDCVTAKELTKGPAPAGLDTNGDGYITVAKLKAQLAKGGNEPGGGGPGSPSGQGGQGGPGGEGAPGAGSGGALGGGPQGGAPGAGGSQSDRFDTLNKTVGLNADELVKVKAIMQKSEARVDELKKQMPTWNAEAKAAIEKIWADEEAAVLEVLTPEDKPKYEAYFKSWMDDRAKDKH
jgi:hypothetical protein